MMPKSVIYIISFFLLLSGQILHAQVTPSVQLSVDKNQILIGEPIRLSLEVKTTQVSDHVFPQFDSLPHFDVIDKGNLDSLVSADGATYHQEWRITSFDSGTHYIPALSVSIEHQIYRTDSLMIEVSYGNVDTTKDYHDIKGIIDVQNPAVKYIPWVVGLMMIVGLFLFFWFIRHPFPNDSVRQIVSGKKFTPVEEAMNALDELKKMILNDGASVKKYYSGINDVFRVFIQQRLGIVTMEKTNEELIMKLASLNMDRDLFSKLTNALRMSDFVKFAKYIPGPFENADNLEQVRASIININENAK